jgi:hypothetical protein
MAKPAFPDPTEFREAARIHQRAWVRDHLHVQPTHSKRVTLPVAEAQEGKNFFSSAVRKAVVDRFGATFALNGSGQPSTRAADALCSAHIPFNLFAPLRGYLGTAGLTQLVTALAARPLASVLKIGFEFACRRARRKIGDNTSFDAYLLARVPGSDGEHGPAIFLGVEVKYTEGYYPWGKTEKKRMSATDDSYHKLTVSSGLFRVGVTDDLRTRHLKQMWRNMLLGSATAEAMHTEFMYLHLYPKGNVYQAAACSKFAEQLTAKGQRVFRPITYEGFLGAAAAALPADAVPWLEYLRARYLVPALGSQRVLC